jgi:hypothetical protein
MASSIVRTSKVVKNFTSGVRTHFDVFDRARDIYLNQIKKAESDYFDRIRRATELLAGEEETVAAAPLQNGDN